MSEIKHSLRPHPGGLALSVLYILLLIVCFWFVLSSMLAQWADDPNYTHGFFVLPMALVLAWKRRRLLAVVPASTSVAGAGVMLVAGFVYLAGVLAAELFTMRFSLVMMTAGMVLAVQGRARMRILLFPCLFLLFMIPLPYIFYYKLTFPMQLQSSRLTAAILSALGMPVVRNGNVIHLENYALEVVTACSGLRSMMTLGTLAVFMADFLRRTWPWKLLLVALVIPIAILANTARLVSTAVISALSGAEAAESYLHDVSGVVVFMIGFVILALCGLLLERVGKQ
jgi:exosortase